MSTPIGVSYGMPTCESCLHWRPPQTEEDVWLGDTKHGRCAAALHDESGVIGYGADDWDVLSKHYDQEEIARRRLLSEYPMVVMDGSGYMARLFTLPTHYCALHQWRAAL